MTTRKKSAKKKASKNGASSKKSASTRSTRAPTGSRKAGTKKSTTSSSARSVSGLSESTNSKTSKASKATAAAKSGGAKKATRTVKQGRKTTAVRATTKRKVVKKAPVKKKKTARKRAEQKQVEALVASSVAPEMAEAMLDEMRLGNEDAALEREAAREQRERDLLSRLAVAMNRHDDMPNQELAANIVFHLDTEAVDLLVHCIERGDDVHAPDAARVLCEVGSRDVELLYGVEERLIHLCQSGQEDMLAFAMFALSPVAERVSVHLWDMRDVLWNVLADDNQHAEMARAAAVRLLSALCASGPDFARTLAGGLVDLLGKCMPKDVALYAESVLPALGTAHSHRAKPVLDRRMKELTPAEVARLRRAVRCAQTGGVSAAA
jgi:hypothetical protein